MHNKGGLTPYLIASELHLDPVAVKKIIENKNNKDPFLLGEEAIQ